MFASIFLRFLNWEASLSKNNSGRVIESLQLHEGQMIADIGSGGGYFTLEFARRAGKTGRVYAIDVEQDYLDFIRRQSQKEGLDNVFFVLATGGDLNLPSAGLDLAFARNVFHHLPEPENYFRNLRTYLKPEGKVAVIEHRRESRFSFVTLFKHYTPPEAIMLGMEKAGYLLTSSFDFLPGQTFSLFKVRTENQ